MDQQQQQASVQPKLLKQINTYKTKEELLALVSICHGLLDPINLVTCVYRLARMYAAIRNPSVRGRWSTELKGDAVFVQLIGEETFNCCCAKRLAPNSGFTCFRYNPRSHAPGPARADRKGCFQGSRCAVHLQPDLGIGKARSFN